MIITSFHARHVDIFLLVRSTAGIRTIYWQMVSYMKWRNYYLVRLPTMEVAHGGHAMPPLYNKYKRKQTKKS